MLLLLFNSLSSHSFTSIIQLDPAKTKHPECRNIFDVIRSFIEGIAKSEGKKHRWIKIQKAIYGHEQMLKNFPIHRWGAAEGVLERALMFWKSIGELYNQVHDFNPLEEHYDSMLQLHAIMAPMRKVQVSMLLLLILLLKYIYANT